jgi:hypothetical protein
LVTAERKLQAELSRRLQRRRCEMFKRLKAKLLGQKPLDHDEIMFAYMDAAKHVKPAPLFAKDFARLIEAKHGIIGRYKTEPMNYDD